MVEVSGAGQEVRGASAVETGLVLGGIPDQGEETIPGELHRACWENLVQAGIQVRQISARRADRSLGKEAAEGTQEEQGQGQLGGAVESEGEAREDLEDRVQDETCSVHTALASYSSKTTLAVK